MDDSLNDILRHAWELLAQGVKEERPGVGAAVLATVGLNGRANARTVVVRRIDAARRALFVNTDIRSPKRDEIERDAHGTFVFYDPGRGIQLRIEVRLHVHYDNTLTRAAWDALSGEGKLNYQTAFPPGRPTSESKVAMVEAPASAYAHFCVIEAVAVHMDWLQVSVHPHRRAAFRWSADGTLQASWLYP